MKTILYISVFLLGSASLHAQIYGVGNGGGFAKAVKGAPGSEFKLPIQLLSFKASLQQNHVHLTWQTASEQNNDFFTLEKSQDAQNFTAVAQIPGAGNSNVTLNYRHLDPKPYEGYTYYRLKQTDINGAFSYSQIADVFLSVHENPIKVYPNPAQDKLFVVGLNPNITLRIFNSLGSVVPFSVWYDGAVCILDVLGLPKGVYLIQGGGVSERFVKE